MSNKTNRWGVLFAIAILAFCSHTLAADDQVQVVSESDLKSFWLPSHDNPPPQYPIDAIKAGAQGCVAVALEIHSDGSVSNVRVWHSDLTNVSARKEIEQSAMLSAIQSHFVPAPMNKQRTSVYTYQVVTFSLNTALFMEKLKAKCEMTDFPQQVQAMINSTQAGKKP
ncbi:MAG: Thioredoxin reductase [Rhodanobacteraceae bacterium]|jgi:TonB family protein|nr:MAG: Thioredoxin reductase [Rhodanobacteraceae bacterium]